jgi:hypothetical protein
MAAIDAGIKRDGVFIFYLAPGAYISIFFN